MSYWYRFHLNDTLKALATPDKNRFFVQLREPLGENRRPLEFYRWKLSEAQQAADEVVQAYYPHDCDGESCGGWIKLES
jgi:hypothetical protein